VTGTLEQQAIQALQDGRRGDACEDRDEEWAAFYAAGRGAPAPPRDTGTQPAKAALPEILRGLMVPWSQEELDAAREPWPHAFQERHTGLFPVGEVSIVAAAGREGKTTVEVGLAVAMVIDHSLAGMSPLPGRSVIVYSAEDDRAQYARKVAAQTSLLGSEHADQVRQRLLVPNLDDAGMVAARTLVMVLEGQPLASGTVDAIIQAIRPMMDRTDPPGLLVFETASTLSEAEESNPGFRVLVLALKRIARELQVAVLVSHHVSQASLSGLPDLNVATTDIRGGTALVNNARQTAILVNLGSDDDPFPDNDARTVLRRLVAGDQPDKVTAWISLDSSKGITPPPVFFRWVSTDWGPAAVELDPPSALADRSWRKVLEMVRAERSGMRDAAKEERASAKASEMVQKAIDAVVRLQAQGEVTARRVREALGRSQDVTARVLAQAVADGHLEIYQATIRGKATDVYRFGGTTEGCGNG